MYHMVFPRPLHRNDFAYAELIAGEENRVVKYVMSIEKNLILEEVALEEPLS